MLNLLIRSGPNQYVSRTGRIGKAEQQSPLEVILRSILGVEVVKIPRHVALWRDAVSGRGKPDAGDA